MGNRNNIFTVDVLFALLVGGILLILLFPLPTPVLDVLLVMNLSLAIFILVVMFYLQTPMDFSSFPSVLLIITLLRLSLNVASTKLILLHGHAGQVIQAFGEFVVGNNYVVGAVVFVILILIQFLVITKGAGRIAEVSARFTLDAMPGKQMSIDADLNAGIIDENEARSRRESLSAEADFFGSMDGASKFVKGDAIAGLVITAVNILGGLAIGVFQQDMSASAALQTYTILTIGDGLVSQIPALIISVSAGILTTKAAQSGGLGGHITSQLLRRPEPLYVSGAMLLFLALLPGLPFFPFAAIACLTLVTASRVRVLVNRGDATGGSPAGATPSLPEKGSAPAPSTEKPDEDEESAAYVPVQPMCLEIGFGLVPLVDERIGGDLISRLGVIRAQVRQELGIMIPPISVQDNLSLGNNEYRILLRGLERARGEVQVGMHLAINPGDVSGHIEGSRTTDPAFGFDAVWIPGRRVDTAESKGYTVVECSSVITTHATKIVEECAADLLGRQSVSDLLEEVKQTDRAVIEELVPQRLSIGVVHRVLQHLLAEQVPVHDLASILECLSDYSTQSKEPLVLCEFCRQALKGHIVARYVSPDRKLHAVVLEPHLESRLQEFMSDREQGMLAIAPELAESILQQIQATSESAKKRTEHDLVLLVAPGIRPHLSRLVGRVSPLLPVLSYAEISDEVSLQVLGTVPDVEQLEEVPA